MEQSTQPLAFPVPGAHPSKPDYRALIVAAAVADSASPTPSLPAQYYTDFSKLGGPLNQLQTPACVSHAMAQLMKLWWYSKTGQVVDFSPRFLHALSANFWTGANDGRDPVSVAKIAQTYGCATTATCPNDTTLSPAAYMDKSAISQVAKNEALQYKIPGYILVKAAQLDIRTNILKYGAVSLLFRIGPEFWQDKNGNPTWEQKAIDPVRPPKGSADIVSGHELVGVGWNASIENLLNHWGKLWAHGGEADYLWNEWQSYVVEGLAIAEVPGAALDLVKGLPPPGEFKHNFASGILYGQQNDEVRALQIALTIDGENTYPEITGYYGDKTAQAVLAFQKKCQVAPPDELDALQGRTVGPATRAALNKLFNI